MASSLLKIGAVVVLSAGAIALLVGVAMSDEGGTAGGVKGSTRLVGPTIKVAGGIDSRPPRELAAAAAVPLRQYVLAVMVESEAGDQGWAGKVAKGYTALNDAMDLGWKLSDGKPDVVRVLTYDTAGLQAGYLGEQLGRRYATSRTPTADSVAAAAEVLRLWGLGPSHDPTKSPTGQRAVKFNDPRAFGKQAGTGSWAEVDDRWRNKEGREAWRVAGVEGTWFYGPSRGRALVS